MRLLCIDHFFAQDIEALRDARGEHQCWAIPYDPFLRAAYEVFDEEVWTGIEAFFRDEHAAARRRYAEVVAPMVDELYETYRPDAFCAPSDTFFWIRAVIERAQQIGVPFVVLQKEATIPPGWLEGPAQEWGRISPFIADHMLVSSENHAKFWINGGVDPAIVDVTGQPRFDLYAEPERARPLHEHGVDVPPGRPTLLFLTYDVNAYMPVIDRTGLAPWQQMRDETEAVLREVAAEGRATVLIKGHPQPAEDQSAHLAELARSPGIQIVDPQADVRHLICRVDAIVGFQTTALLESLAAGRPTIYTWWTEATARYADDLIPFHLENEALDVATSPQELRAAIERALAAEPRSQARVAAARALVETYIGPVGGAAHRSWQIMERLAAAARAQPNAQRASLEARARAQRARVVSRALAGRVLWTAASGAAGVGYPVYRRARELGGGVPLEENAFRRELQERRRLASERLTATLK